MPTEAAGCTLPIKRQKSPHPDTSMQLYNLHRPKHGAVPVIAHLPHSGSFVPAEIAAQFTPEHLASLPHTDWHLDKLYRFLPDLGITVLQATHSRYVVDLNRAISDPILGPFHTSVIAEAAPVQSAERTTLQLPVYQNQPASDELQARIARYYLPYFAKLEELLNTAIQQFGRVYLLHLHSFFGPFSGHVIDLGDGNGKGCREQLVGCVERHFRVAGYETARNSPYSGAFAARRFGGIPGVESLQIEVRYPVYLGDQDFDGPQPPSAEVPAMTAAQNRFELIFRSIVSELVNSS